MWSRVEKGGGSDGVSRCVDEVLTTPTRRRCSIARQESRAMTVDGGEYAVTTAADTLASECRWPGKIRVQGGGKYGSLFTYLW